MFELDGKVAIVSGSSYGIGLSIAQTLAKQGAKVVIVGRKADAVRDAVGTINSSGGKAIGIPADVLAYDKAQELVDGTVQEFGKVDILVNVVGGGFRKMFVDYTEKDWDELIALNLKSVFNCTQPVARQMIKQGTGGSIINISSVAAWVPDQTMAAYSASKGAVNSLTLTIAQELGGNNIRVNCIAPGFVETPGARELSPGTFDQLKAKRAAVTSLNRYGSPQDIAAAAVYLASDESTFMTGRELRIDGGVGVKFPHHLDD
jgi:NAD(P)-dependent dehydrogenase (short-subunit alcohol dehydrogenase family)